LISPHIHIPYNRITEHINLIREKRLDLEIYFSGEMLDTVRPEDIEGLADLLDHSPSISFHAPFMDLSPGAVDSAVREVTMQRLNQTIDMAEILRPKAIVCHSGYEKWRYALKPDWWVEQSLRTWSEINDRAFRTGAKIAIENIFEDEPSNLTTLMERMDSENFGICFDTGHFNLFSSLRIEEWMDALNPYIIELHLHDNDRSADQHLPIGEGTFDFGRFFSLLLNRKCIHTIEAHSPDRILRSIENIKRFIGT
jgi:sugar phosphate isomerase/epimerase